MLGVSPFLGRNFLPEEDRPDRRHEVLLTYGYWKQRFGGNGEVVGSKIWLNEMLSKLWACCRWISIRFYSPGHEGATNISPAWYGPRCPKHADLASIYAVSGD
jgi:hypothetical protein